MSTDDDSLNADDLFIPDGVTFVGTIHAPGIAQINGSVTGEITSNKLEIGPLGHINGKVRAKEIDVHGVLMNDLVCLGLLQIRKTGKVSGQLAYSDIDIERGGQFEGDMHKSGKR
jgi:cytoskeletal protein CcmA (bactofilin family)